MLTVTDLSIIHQQKPLLEDINLTLKPATLYGLIGHNGSGKSTLIKALARETKPSKGQICIDGKDLTTFSHKALAKTLAYLPQKLPDQAGFLVEDLVMLGRYPYQSWLSPPSNTDRQIVDEAMTMTGVKSLASRPLLALSGGEKARAWLAMCLAQKTNYLLLDEPLAALDVVYQVQVLKLIWSLAHEVGLSVLVIIHDLNLAAQFCDEIIALKGGRICHMGTPKTLMTTQTLKEIFGIELTLLTHPITQQKVAVV